MSNLYYISTDESGYSRKRWGRGFTYLDEHGKTIRDDELRDWIETIAIPPAWTDVWISPRKNGHILAVGRDDKGRKQYRYHPEWQKQQSHNKFDKLYEFGQYLPKIRQTTDEDLRQRKVSRTRVLAAIVRLLENTLIRIGNIEYAKNNDAYGLTTLRDKHADIKGEKIEFDFVGKSGKEHTILLRDARLARTVQRCQDIPGYRLFQYYDENGERREVDSADVNTYLRDIIGEDFTAKVFRTWGASSMAIKYLCDHPNEAQVEATIRNCIQHVAEALGNTTAVCRDYYIHPRIMEAYESTKLCKIYQEFEGRESSKYDLTPAEKTLIKLME